MGFNQDVFQGLDEQQQQCVKHIDGPALIVAGAGAGKTTVLVRRAANLIQNGVDPSQILLLTFTRAASASILDRARQYTPEAQDIVGGTFHSVASRLIRENHQIFGLPEGFTILDPSDVEDTLKRIATEVEGRNMPPRSSTIHKILSFSRNTCTSISVCLNYNFQKYRDHLDYIQEISDRYLQYKKKHFILDFDDLLEFWAKMTEYEELAEQLRERFRYVMVDEYQDTNALQLRIIYGMGGSNPNIMAVGDPSQSIYAFRGAAPGTMFDFQKQWPQTKKYLIETNYRSTPEIVHAADNIDRSMKERFERNLDAHKASTGDPIQLVKVGTPDDEANWIAEKILENRAEGIKLSEHAVIVRSSRRARHVELALTAAGIPYKFSGGIKIHEAAHIKDVIAVARVTVNPADAPAWMRFLTLMPKVGEKSAAKISEELTDLGSIEDAIKMLSDMAIKKTNLAQAIPALKAAASAATASEAIEGIKLALRGLMAEKWADEWDWREKDIDDIVNIAATQGSLEEFLRTITIDVAIDKKETSASSMQDEQPMTVATIHASKGLEWETVFIPSFIYGHLPSMFIEEEEDLEEEKRLFYVAVTRSKKHLHLMRPAAIMSKGMQMAAGPTPFERTISEHTKEQSVKNKMTVSMALNSDMKINGW